MSRNVEPSFDKLTADVLTAPPGPAALELLLDEGHEAAYEDELPLEEVGKSRSAVERVGASNGRKKRQNSLF